MANVHDLYHKCNHHEPVLLAASDADAEKLASKLSAMVVKVWKAKNIPEGGIDDDVLKEYVSRLWTGITEGYGLDFPAIDFDTPDFKTLLKLRENVWQFSAAKNYQQLAAISRELVDANGKLRSFADFKDAAIRINIDHVRHLETEYNTAIAGGQMAGKWVDIEAAQDVLPYLQFDAVIDGKTSAICRSLDGVIVRIDSPIVKKYYPPNHYGCRLTVRQLADADVTPFDEIPQPEIPKIFQVNLGQQGLAFPKDHPYFDGLPDGFKKSINKLIPEA